MVEYTPRFIEDFVLDELRDHPEQTDQDIADRFMELHGQPYNGYLQALEGVIRAKYEAEISKLDNNSTKGWLKERFLEAMQHNTILGSDNEEVAEKRMGRIKKV